jgi:uncharacterized protein (TIGR02757 family)
MSPPLREHLERLYREADHARHRDADPVAFVHRYQQPEDQEIMGIFAAALAFGKVSLFFPVLVALADIFDGHGGPRAFVDDLDPDRAAELAPLYYRWSRGSDLALLAGALQRARRRGPLQDLVAGPGSTRARLERALTTLRAHAVDAARDLGAPVASVAALPRGLRFLLPDPASSSGLKRWNLFLRWMVRPATEGVDLGIWTTLTPAELVMPVDLHVGRISRFIGLTQRADASWRTAEEITAALRALDPADPVRFDFAIAHLGISDACRGHRDEVVCPVCPLAPICTAPAR